MGFGDTLIELVSRLSNTIGSMTFNLVAVPPDRTDTPYDSSPLVQGEHYGGHDIMKHRGPVPDHTSVKLPLAAGDPVHCNLLVEQQEQLRPFFADLRQRFAGGHGDGHGGGDGAAGARGDDADAVDLRAQRQHFQTQFREAVIAVLTPEQRDKYQALQSGRGALVRRARVWVLDENGAPEPVDVGIGISDGSFTEIVSGELEEGQLIITGVNEAAESRTRRFTGFRL